MTEPSQVHLVGVGLNATDTLIFLPEFPSCGSKVNLRSVSISPGGQVATAVIACQRWGLRTRYIGKLGDDHAAQVHRQEFERAGTETCLETVDNCSSAQSIILVDERGERTVLWGRDPRLALRADELDRKSIVHARALLLDGCDTEAAIAAAKWARAAGVPIIADLDDAYPGIEELLENIDYLIVSRDFPAQIVHERKRACAYNSAYVSFSLRYPRVSTTATSGAKRLKFSTRDSRFRRGISALVSVLCPDLDFTPEAPTAKYLARPIFRSSRWRHLRERCIRCARGWKCRQS